MNFIEDIIKTRNCAILGIHKNTSPKTTLPRRRKCSSLTFIPQRPAAEMILNLFKTLEVRTRIPQMIEASLNIGKQENIRRSHLSPEELKLLHFFNYIAI